MLSEKAVQAEFRLQATPHSTGCFLKQSEMVRASPNLVQPGAGWPLPCRGVDGSRRKIHPEQ